MRASKQWADMPFSYRARGAMFCFSLLLSLPSFVASPAAVAAALLSVVSVAFVPPSLPVHTESTCLPGNFSFLISSGPSLLL